MTDGFFEARFRAKRPPAAYRLKITRADGSESVEDDPYRFPPVLGEMDVWLLGEGTHLRPYEMLGAVPAATARTARHALRRLGAERLARRRRRRLQRLGRPAPSDAAAPRMRRVGAVPAAASTPARATSSRSARSDGAAAAAEGRSLRAARPSCGRPRRASSRRCRRSRRRRPARRAANWLDAPMTHLRGAPRLLAPQARGRRPLADLGRARRHAGAVCAGDGLHAPRTACR